MGVPGLRYSVSATGRRTQTVGIPGTGVSYVRSGTGARRAAAASDAVRVKPRTLPSPGIFASQAERRFHAGLQAYVKGDAQAAYTAFASAITDTDRNVSDDLFAGLAAIRLGDLAAATRHLERVVQSDIALPDALMTKYLPTERTSMALQVSLTDRVTATVDADSLGATLMLAELYQEAGRNDEAIGLVQELLSEDPSDPTLRLSLADLLYDADDFDGVVELAAEVTNDDDITLATMHLGAKALANKGLLTAAVERLTACLRKTAARDQALLTEIRYNRAEAYELLGRPRQASADYERVYAANPDYRDVADRVRSLKSV